MTATATMVMRQEIAKILKLTSYEVVSSPIDRPNIKYNICRKIQSPDMHTQEKYSSIILPYVEDLLVQREQFPLTLAYTTKEWGAFLHHFTVKMLYNGTFSNRGHPLVAHYHADLPKKVDIFHRITSNRCHGIVLEMWQLQLFNWFHAHFILIKL